MPKGSGRSQKKSGVGYGRPPKKNQFKKGNSGNPKGRPKRKESFSGIFTKVFLKGMTVTTKAGRRKVITPLELILRHVLQGALKGDTKSFSNVIQAYRTFYDSSESAGANEQLQGLFAALKAGPVE